MNKKLLAIAIAGVVAAPLAQAQTANVTLYGRLNLDAEVILQVKQDTPVTASSPAVKQNIYRVSSNSSRLGVRGTESLGGGLNAIFQIESGFDASNSGGNLATRETFVGLQAGWGTLKVGYFLSPYDDIQSIFGSAPTLQTGILGSQSIWSNTGYVGNTTDTGSFDDRVANSIRYDSPNIAGFTGSVQVGGRDTGGSDGGTLAQQRRHAYVISTGGQYNNGPLAAGITYEVHNNLRDGSAANPHLQDQAVTAAASWNFGIVKIGAAYEGLKYDIATGGDLKRDFWALSATANLGPGQLYAAYWAAGNGRGGAKCVTAAGIVTCPRVGAVTLGPDTKAQQWEVSYTYPLSKRTLLYTGYTMIDNKANANYNFGVNQIQGMCGGNGASCGDAGRPQGIVAGMVHFF
jgi:predicted porin